MYYGTIISEKPYFYRISRLMKQDKESTHAEKRCRAEEIRFDVQLDLLKCNHRSERIEKICGVASRSPSPALKTTFPFPNEYCIKFLHKAFSKVFLANLLVSLSLQEIVEGIICTFNYFLI